MDKNYAKLTFFEELTRRVEKSRSHKIFRSICLFGHVGTCLFAQMSFVQMDSYKWPDTGGIAQENIAYETLSLSCLRHSREEMVYSKSEPHDYL